MAHCVDRFQSHGGFDESLESQPTISPSPSPSPSPPSSSSVLSTSGETKQQARIVILALWPCALQSQIRYYTHNYQILYPDARVILLSSTPDFDHEVIADISNHLSESRPTSCSVLIHIFGTASASRVGELLRAYHGQTGSILPAQTIIHDTVPTLAVKQTSRHLREYFNILTLITWATMNTWMLSVLTNGRAESWLQNSIRDDLYDPKLLPSNIVRSYIFEGEDRMSFWKPSTVESDQSVDYDELGSHVCWEHANFPVRRELVDRQRRLSVDQEIFWAAIESAWE